MTTARRTIAALVLPVAALALLWGWTDWRSRQGTTWQVQVEGYDPRDLLRGHYVLYRYRWPGLADDAAFTGDLCIAGEAPRIARVTMADGQPCANRLRAHQGTGDLARGRYYVPQTQARAIERKLLDPGQMATLSFRLRGDGLIVPLDLRFRPRTAAESADTPPPVTATPAP
ncbi:GDYXXLXY domain-containing protein [Leptolyngbya sp. 15MV]|nr:GDYXXLXY domain-containing protein [Leptolyngbya sp. 15MV]